MRKSAIFLLALALGLRAEPASTYPLDVSEETGIHRLEAYHLAREILLERGTLPPGAFLPSADIRLRLGDPNFQVPAPDAEFSAKIRKILGSDAGAYGVSVLDMTDPSKPRYAEINGSRSQNPGSVGKLMVALGWFQALADIYPNDIAARKRVLLNTQITAGDFIIKDSHKVPIYKPGDPMVLWRPIELGDRNNLWTWFDWMASASSNAAASQMIAELLLLREFGTDYPVSKAKADAFFANTSKSQLSKKLREAIEAPVTRNGLNLGKLRQGSFFTRTGKARVPGQSSYATSSELMRFLTTMEQGKLVDPFSSLEIKRLIYLTDTRVRYGSSAAIHDSALYYKSGSLYSCKPEKGFTCGKYMGNKYNYLASTAIVETHDPKQPLAYIVVVLSNVLRKNSAEQHENLATEIHRLMERLHPRKGAPSL